MYIGPRGPQYEGSTELSVHCMITCEVLGGKTQSNRNALSFPITSWSWLTNWTHMSLERSCSCSNMGRTCQTNIFMHQEFAKFQADRYVGKSSFTQKLIIHIRFSYLVSQMCLSPHVPLIKQGWLACIRAATKITSAHRLLTESQLLSIKSIGYGLNTTSLECNHSCFNMRQSSQQTNSMYIHANRQASCYTKLFSSHRLILRKYIVCTFLPNKANKNVQ